MVVAAAAATTTALGQSSDLKTWEISGAEILGGTNSRALELETFDESRYKHGLQSVVCGFGFGRPGPKVDECLKKPTEAYAFSMYPYVHTVAVEELKKWWGQPIFRAIPPDVSRFAIASRAPPAGIDIMRNLRVVLYDKRLVKFEIERLATIEKRGPREQGSGMLACICPNETFERNNFQTNLDQGAIWISARSLPSHNLRSSLAKRVEIDGTEVLLSRLVDSPEKPYDLESRVNRIYVEFDASVIGTPTRWEIVASPAKHNEQDLLDLVPTIFRDDS